MRWFPITDPSREADIRMRRRRALMLLSALVFVPWIVLRDHGTHRRARSPGRDAPTIAAARDDRRTGLNETIPATGGDVESQGFVASSLRIDLPCARSVTVLPDPLLAGKGVLSVPAGAQGAMDAISISNGAITQRAECADDSPVTIRTGNVMPLVLVQSGDNALRAGRFDGAVTINSSGSGTVSLDHAGSLTVAGQNSGDVTVGSVAGPLNAAMDGSGDLRVAGGTVPVLDIASHGSGDLLLDRVRVLGGRAVVEGSGDLRLGAVSGIFQAETDGSGDIVIQAAESDRLTLRGSGSGDIMVHGGRIATLDADRTGWGNLSVLAEVQGGRLAHDGEGEVRIPNSGSLARTR